MVDVAESYDRMSETERARYEQDHFDRLPAIEKFRVANREFSSGMTPVGEKAAIIDNAYGNGDGIWDQTDAKILEEKRNDMGFLNGMRDAGTAMFTAAAYDAAPTLFAGGTPSFQFGVGGVLGGLFNSNASGDQFSQTASADVGLNNAGQGFFQRLTSAVGLG